ncbi:MAG: hypothetical protein ABW162_14170 [Candidatus Sedimenticola sp. PURPLELP]
MKRRDFLRTLGGAGLMAGLPGLGLKQAMAEDIGAYTEGPLLFVIKAGGGMQQTAFCDPKEGAYWGQGANARKAGKVGDFYYAPVADNAAFFEKYHRDMLVINGMILGTNAHGAGSYVQQSGYTSSGAPFLSALFAKINGAGLPMPWLTPPGSGRLANGGLVPATITPTGADLKGLASAGAAHVPESHISILRRFQTERGESLIDGHALPFAANKIGHLNDARNNSKLLQHLAGFMPEKFSDPIHLQLVAMQAGVTVAGYSRLGGFDTHGMTPNSGYGLFSGLTRHVDYVWRRAEELGIADRLLVHITSDVGREIEGRKHYTVASTVLMAKNKSWTGRVVGTSGENFKPTRMNPVTLQPEANGVVITPAHVQRTMRRLLGIDGHELCRKYEFKDPEIDLLNPKYSSPQYV